MPSDGENELILYNLRDSGWFTGTVKEKVIIDSIFLKINEKKRKIAGRIEIDLDQKKKISFFVNDITCDFHKEIELIFYSSDPEIAQVVSFSLNNEDPMDEDLYDLVISSDDKNIFHSENDFKYECIKSIKSKENRLAVRALLGTDSRGYDIFSRIIYGTRIVMIIVFVSSFISLFTGIILGMLRGFYHNYLTQFIRVISELFSSLSLYVVAILITLFFGKNILVMIIAFSMIQWVEIESNISMKVKAILEEDYIKASRMVGKSDLTLMIEDVLPVIAPDILISFFYLAKRIIVIEASLSYIGYSVELPYSTWGNIISDARLFIFTPEALHFVLPSVLAIIITSLTFNILEIIYRKKFRIS